MAAYARCWNTQRKTIQTKINSFQFVKEWRRSRVMDLGFFSFQNFVMNDNVADMKRITNHKSNDIWFMMKIVHYSISFYFWVFHQTRIFWGISLFQHKICRYCLWTWSNLRVNIKIRIWGDKHAIRAIQNHVNPVFMRVWISRLSTSNQFQTQHPLSDQLDYDQTMYSIPNRRPSC